MGFNSAFKGLKVNIFFSDYIIDQYNGDDSTQTEIPMPRTQICYLSCV